MRTAHSRRRIRHDRDPDGSESPAVYERGASPGEPLPSNSTAYRHSHWRRHHHWARNGRIGDGPRSGPEAAVGAFLALLIRRKAA